jgi:hypothetical protein
MTNLELAWEVTSERFGTCATELAATDARSAISATG